MAMTVIVTRDVAPRFRGFLASCMLEIAPGVYTAPRMSKAVRERIQHVMDEWYQALAESGSIIMTWNDPASPGGQTLACWGLPATEIVSLDGFHMARRRIKEPATKLQT